MPLNYSEAIEQQEHSIVILGKFNAQIFSPAWFGMEGLLSRDEANEGEVRINSRGISLFKAAWLEVEVTDDRFKVLTRQTAYYEMLRDLTIGTFQSLNNTPVRAIGINFQTHLRLYTKDDLESFLNKLSPLKLLQKYFIAPDFERIAFRNPTENGHVRFSIEKSLLLEHGVYIDINDHFEKIEGQEVWKDDLGNAYVKAEKLVPLITNGYTESVKRCDDTLSKIWKIKNDQNE